MSSLDHLTSNPRRAAPIDLVGILLVVALANFAVFATSLGPIRIVIGFLFILFVPGYALVAALFPESGESPQEAGGRTDSAYIPSQTGESTGVFDTDRGLDVAERIALSFALSFAIVPLLAMGVTLSPLSFSTGPLFVVISVFTVICALLALIRRLSLPDGEQVKFSAIGSTQGAHLSLRGSDSRGEILLNVALAAAVVLALGTLSFAVLSPTDGEQYTEFYVLTEDEDGELVADGYPDAIEVGEPTELHVGIENHEQERIEYNTVVQLQRVQSTDGQPVVTERYTVDQFSTVLSPDENWVTDWELLVSDSVAGEDLRLQFLLYKDSVPETPTGDTAHRELHIWIDVEMDDEPGAFDVTE